MTSKSKPAITLTESQKEAVSKFAQFLDSDQAVFMLKGAAGTGKTTLVEQFLKLLDERDRTFRIMAPTGRAAYIIAGKTDKEATTIHKGIYILASKLPKIKSKGKSKQSDNSMHSHFGLRKNEDSADTVYIIDEASMISDILNEPEEFSFGSGKLLTDLFTFAGQRKVVFVGDYAQLPPVGMESSPALDEAYISRKFKRKTVSHMLREVIRQGAKSGILHNASIIRDHIEQQHYNQFAIESGSDCIAEDYDLLRPYFALSDKRPHSQSAIIAFSNRQVLSYNLTVRRHYFGRDAQRLIPGDLLMIARNNYAFQADLFNGNIVQVAECDPDDSVESRTIGVAVKGKGVEAIELRFRKAQIAFREGYKKIKIPVTLLDSFIDHEEGAVPAKVSQALLIDLRMRLPDEIALELPDIHRHLMQGRQLSANQLAIYEKYLDIMASDPYYNAVVCKYGYALTCHKAQGGEWHNVFVDMDRHRDTATESYFRWAYTAITRGSRKVWHYRAPRFNFE